MGEPPDLKRLRLASDCSQSKVRHGYVLGTGSSCRGTVGRHRSCLRPKVTAVLLIGVEPLPQVEVITDYIFARR